MHIDECYQLGYIIKPHGLKGELGIYLDVDIPELYKNLESVFVEINKSLVPFLVHKISIKKNKAILKLDEVDDFPEAEKLKKCDLYLPLKFLPKLRGNQFYYHEIIGYSVVDLNLGSIGKIQEVYTLPNQDLLSMIFKGKEVLIPVKDEIIKKVDKSKKEIFVELPDGLLEIYLED